MKANNKLFYILLLFLFLFIISCDEDELVSPKPPYCMTDSEHLCVSTSSAMLMKYWSEKSILKRGDCAYYKEEIKNELGVLTKQGEFEVIWPKILLVRLKKVAKRNMVEKSSYIVGGGVIDVNFDVIEIIRKQIKYSKYGKDERSPWDRPLIFMVGEDIYKKYIKKAIFWNHSVLIWGIGYEENKNYHIVRFRIHNPMFKPSFQNYDSMYLKIYFSKLTDGQDSVNNYDVIMNVTYLFFNKKSDCKK